MEFTVEVEHPTFDQILSNTRRRLCEESETPNTEFRTTAPPNVYRRFVELLDSAAEQRQAGEHELAWQFLCQAVEVASFRQGIQEGLYLGGTKSLTDHATENARKSADTRKALKLSRTKETLEAALAHHAKAAFATEGDLREVLHDAGRKAGLFQYMSDGRYKQLRAEDALTPILDHLQEKGGLTAPRHPVKRPKRTSPW